MDKDIGDYAMIGDCETAGLVRRDGSIEWLCWPRFDSAACFSALLGDERHGFWRISPCEAATATRAYLGEVETTALSRVGRRVGAAALVAPEPLPGAVPAGAGEGLAGSVGLAQPDADHLGARGGHVLAHVVGADGQLAVAAIDQHRQPDRGRPALVDQRVHRRAHGAAGVEHVVDDDHRRLLEREGQVSALDLWRLAGKRPIDNEALLDAFLARLEPRYEALLAGKFDAAGWTGTQITTNPVNAGRSALRSIIARLQGCTKRYMSRMSR